MYINIFYSNINILKMIRQKEKTIPTRLLNLLNNQPEHTCHVLRSRLGYTSETIELSVTNHTRHSITLRS